MKRAYLLCFVMALLAVPSLSFADSISPASYETTLGLGESITIRKTVTVDDMPPVDAPVDVFFLSDTTGSMGGIISDVRDAASAVMAAVSGLGDLAFGVGEYRDFPPEDTRPYLLNQDITTNTTLVQNAINTWTASGGGDGPESQLYALQQVATTTSWRAGSTRILLWFGDVYGHDPSGGVTESDAIDALNAAGIQVEAFNNGLLDFTNQATNITAATGGNLYSGLGTGDVITEITNAITTAILEYSMVSLSPNNDPLKVGVSITPGAYIGDYDRSTTRTFDFEVTFTGLEMGTWEFTIDALVDRGIVARERDRIIVTPEPSTLALLGLGILGLGFGAYRRRKK